MILYNNTLYISLRSLVQFFGIPRGALAICLLTFSRAALAQPMLTKTPYLARKVPQRKETAVKFMLKNVTVCIYIYTVYETNSLAGFPNKSAQGFNGHRRSALIVVGDNTVNSQAHT